MIDLYYWPTPNGHKITIFLEEAELEYKIVPVNISAGDQFKPAFLKIAPNNRMPAIVDKKPLISNEPISVFESGAILLYLANKYNIFCGKNELEKVKVLEWLFWQMGVLDLWLVKIIILISMHQKVLITQKKDTQMRQVGYMQF